MGVRHGVIVALCLALVVSGAACKRKPPPSDPAPSALPADRLGAGEVALSKERAFALPLPRGAKALRGWGGTVDVATDLSPEELANFVRQRVTGGKITAGSGSTHFEQVFVAAEPKRLLDIVVRPGRVVDRVRSEMLVRDVTPTIDPQKLTTEEERWRAAGYRPDGTPLADPKKVE